MGRCLVLISLAMLACTSHAVDEPYKPTSECMEFCARERVPLPNPLPRTGCTGCFHVDADGAGFCRANLNRASWTELATIVRWAVGPTDRDRVYGEACEQQLCPLIDFVEVRRRNIPFETIQDFKMVLARPSLPGGGGLEGVDVRSLPGSSEMMGQYWAGLQGIAWGTQIHGPSCCVGEGCGDAQFVCEYDAKVRLPSECVSTTGS